MKKQKWLNFFGIILIVVPFLVSKFNIFRLISLILGLFIIIFLSFKKAKMFKKIILLILFLIILYVIDYFISFNLNRAPIFSYEIKSSSKISNYNSFFYRVYKCDNEIIFDNFYQKSYVCDTEPDNVEINSLLSDIGTNFLKYKNHFVNVTGKISSISGNSSISFQAYETKENGINGQVSFSDNITLTVLIKDDSIKLDELKVYDKLQVIGRISKISGSKNNKIITMVDAKIINNKIENYELMVNINKNCEQDLKLMSKTDEYTYYSSCLDKIYVRYDEENIYELSYILSDKRLTFEQLTENISKEEYDNIDLYKFNDFNLIKCHNSNNIIIGTSELNEKNSYCESFKADSEIESDEGI